MLPKCENSIPETCYLVPSSAGEFNATVDVTLQSTASILLGGGRGGEGWGHLGIEIFFVAEVVH